VKKDVARHSTAELASSPRPRSASHRPSGFFVLRTPLLPAAVVERWARSTTSDVSEPDARVLHQRLRDWVHRPDVREALWLASPTLDASVSAWLEDPESPRARGVTVNLVRYLCRSATRPTPFGLFSGCSHGRFGARTELELVGLSEYRRHTRLDAEYVMALGERLGTQVWQGLRYRPNSSLSEAGDQLRYVEAQTDPTTRERSFRLVAADRSPALLVTLERAARGRSARELAEALVSDDVSLEEALDYVAALVEAQVLESELEPCVTGRQPADELLVTLQERELSRGAREVLRQVQADLAELDARPLGSSLQRYGAVHEALSTLPLEVDPARLFQVDLHKPARALTLGPAVVRELTAAIELLVRIAEAPPATALERFIAAFVQRYEMAEVPLLEALDEERGVGAALSDRQRFDPSTLLDDLDFPEPPQLSPARGPRDQLLVHAATAALRDGRREWVLSEEDLQALAVPEPAPLPDALSIFATIAARSADAVDRGDFELCVRNLNGPSGARMLGRFCHGDPALLAAVQGHLSDEAALRPGAIFAEIVHLPAGRVGNILCRPVLRGYEIPYLGRSGAPSDRQIPVSDLLVSVSGGRVRLRSRSLGVEVIPRLTTAHLYVHTELMVYRFLCSLQRSIDLRWSWGDVAASVPFLPRVRHGRIVLSLARWLLRPSDIEPLAVAAPEARRQAVLALRDRMALPRWVSVEANDSVLRLDLDNDLMLDSFLSIARSRPTVTLTEVYPEDDRLCVTGPEGRFVHELLAPFVSTREPEREPPPIAGVDTPRHFVPGSEWLYAKLYGGPATADRLLLEVVAPLRADALQNGAADAWFFIRYADPQPHLRVRFHGPPGKLLSQVLVALKDRLAPWIADGRVSSLQLDTYVREVERYGGAAGVPLAEQLFFADSEATLELVATAGSEAHAADVRWRFALFGLHALLDDFGLSLPERVSLLARLEREFARRCQTNRHAQLQVAAKFRKERDAIAALLARQAPGFARAYAIFERRTAAWHGAVERLVRHARSAETTQDLPQLGASFLHMHVNRVLRSEQPLQEWILYEFLRRLYVSELARHAAPAPTRRGEADPGVTRTGQG
jgi:lantibiotic biosynthesis protein